MTLDGSHGAPSTRRRQFEEQGFLVMRGLLDLKAELAALDAAYQELIETLAGIHFAEAGAALPPDFRARPLGERFALLQGASGGHAVEHLDPVLNAFDADYRRRGDLPSAQLPELFRLMRCEALLAALEDLVGPEIAASPTYHLNFKLAESQLALARDTADRFGFSDPRRRAYYHFHLAQTPWHRDSGYSLPDSHESGIVTAWIPMTPAGGERGTLVLVPGSHRERGATQPKAALSERQVEIAAEPGDVVFFHYWLLHGSTPNRSHGDVRWAFNFRYLPRGRAAGRPYLPTVLVRSRSSPQRELHDGQLWSAIWRRALDHLAAPRSPVPQQTDLARAQALTREWERRFPDPVDWLTLTPSTARVWWARIRRGVRGLKRRRRSRAERRAGRSDRLG
jgi:ectoine hydroxylase-related dioxygenase (phytanoyl-CoA dioxygenase family)